MSKERKKLNPASKPKITLEYMEDFTNAATILCNNPTSGVLSSSSSHEEIKCPIAKVLPQRRPPLAKNVVKYRKYSAGSVYRQASRFAPCISSSTNISSSMSGSVEVIISEIENPQVATPHATLSLSPLGEISEGQSEDAEEKAIKNIIDQHRSLNNSRHSHDEEALNKSMKDVQTTLGQEQKEKDIKKLQVRLQVLQVFKQDNTQSKGKDFRKSY
jgi:hypothetical protein